MVNTAQYNGERRFPDDHLESIESTLSVEADIDDPDELVARGEELCHVHAALRKRLHADVTVETDAF